MVVAAAGRTDDAAADSGAEQGRAPAGGREPTDTGEHGANPAESLESGNPTGPVVAGLPAESPVPAGRSTLSPVEEAILEFERAWWQRGPAKDERIRREFGISPTAYYLQLHSLINRADAEAYDPLLVQRITRRMEQGRRWREGT